MGSSVQMRKGIVLAGGTGSRLYPATLAGSKQLLPVYDKPMIYYPISTFLLAGIREILIVCTPSELDRFTDLLGDGSQWGCNFVYKVQPNPGGIAEAFLLGKSFLSRCPSALVLGDNIFYGHGLPTLMESASAKSVGATVFAYKVADPERFGVVAFDKDQIATSIVEKPEVPESSYAVTGLYFYDEHVCDYAEALEPSARGELEITDLNNVYLSRGTLSVELMGRGYAWLDTGTHDSLLDASGFIATLQKRQGTQVACPEEIAFNNGWISADDLFRLAKPLEKTSYGRYLIDIVSSLH